MVEFTRLALKLPSFKRDSVSLLLSRLRAVAACTASRNSQVSAKRPMITRLRMPCTVDGLLVGHILHAQLVLCADETLTTVL